jgi:hypothetical protein
MAVMDNVSGGGNHGKDASTTMATTPVQQGRWHGCNNSKNASNRGKALGNNQLAQ